MGSDQSFRRGPTGRPRLSATSGFTRRGTASSGCSIASSNSVALRPDTTRHEHPSQHSLPWPPQRYGCHTLSTGPRRLKLVEFSSAAAFTAHQDVRHAGELREITIHSMTASGIRTGVVNLSYDGYRTEQLSSNGIIRGHSPLHEWS